MAASEIMRWEQLTRLANKLQWPEFTLTNMIDKEPVQGTFARWDVETPDIEMSVEIGVANAPFDIVKPTTEGTTSQQMLTSNKMVLLSADDMLQQRILGFQERDVRGQNKLLREAANIRKKFGDNVTEYMWANALQGTLAMTVNNAPKTFSWSIPANNLVAATTVWTNVAADIIGDLEAADAAVSAGSGRMAQIAICNPYTMSLMLKNTTVQAWLGQASFSEQYLKFGQVKELMGLEFIKHRGRYAPVGTTDRFTTPFIPNGKVIIMPRPTSDWISLQVGSLAKPEGNWFTEVQGPFNWTENSTDTGVGVKLLFRSARFATIRIPGAICVVTVT